MKYYVLYRSAAPLPRNNPNQVQGWVHYAPTGYYQEYDSEEEARGSIKAIQGQEYAVVSVSEVGAWATPPVSWKKIA